MLLLAAWKAAAHLDLLDRLLLPSPRRIAAALELLAGVVGPGAETTVTAALGGRRPGSRSASSSASSPRRRCGHASAHTGDPMPLLVLGLVTAAAGPPGDETCRRAGRGSKIFQALRLRWQNNRY